MLAEEIARRTHELAEPNSRCLEGLNDEEYFWEPVAGCWSVRRSVHGRWSAYLGPRGTTWTQPTRPR